MGCDIHCYAETRKNDRWIADHADDCTQEGEGDETYWDMPTVYGDRNYGLFGLLAKGVRREFPWSFEQRGIPSDLSPEVKKIFDQGEGDDHSHSWLTLDELRNKRLELLLQGDSDASALHGYLDQMINSIWHKDADGHERRIVFCFDN